MWEQRNNIKSSLVGAKAGRPTGAPLPQWAPTELEERLRFMFENPVSREFFTEITPKGNGSVKLPCGECKKTRETSWRSLRRRANEAEAASRTYIYAQEHPVSRR